MPYAAISNNWSNGIAPYEFGVNGGYYGGSGSGYNNYIYTDRPIYRPGQTVFFKAVVRRDDDAILSALPANTPVTARIRDARNNVVQTFALAFE